MSAPAGAPPAGLEGGGGLPAGAGGGGGSQILQQIETLLAQLAQTEPEPEIQQAVQVMGKQVEALHGIIGKDDEQDMQSGLANPGGAAGGAPGMGAGGAEPELPPGGGAGGAAPEGGGDHHGVAEVHIKMQPGGPSTFGQAKKAAMATHAERGHFDRGTPKGETPTSDRTKNKAKG